MQPFGHQQLRHKAWPVPHPSRHSSTGHCTQSPERCPNGQRRPGPGGPVPQVRRFATLLSRARTARQKAISSSPVRGGHLPDCPREPGATVVGRPSAGVQDSRQAVQPPAPKRFPTASKPGRHSLSLTEDHFSCIRFPPNGFAVFLTLFSKYFSPFPHGTCSLSVSCQYLALDGVYHPFWAAIPNNPTLRAQILPPTVPPCTGLSPSPARLSRTTLGSPSRAKLALQTTIRRCKHRRFQI